MHKLMCKSLKKAVVETARNNDELFNVFETIDLSSMKLSKDFDEQVQEKIRQFERKKKYSIVIACVCLMIGIGCYFCFIK